MPRMFFPLTERRHSWLALGGCFALLLVLAVFRPLAVPDEGRYGEIGRWMLVSGDWMTPRLNGIPFFHKPPLLHWLDAAALAIFGVSPWAVRLVPALHAFGMLLALYFAARRMAGEATARRAVLMLGSSLAFLLGGQYVNHDMLVACWISVAILCFSLSLAHGGERPHAALARWGFVACALGVMSKMLIAVLLPGAVVLVWAVWTGLWRRLLQLPWISGLALFALLAFPWFVVEQLRFPGMFDYLVIGQQFGRYTGTVFNNAQPWWFFVPAALALLLPWSPLVPYLAWTQLRTRSAEVTPQANRWVLLCWVWLLVILVFFSIPRSKILGYILPVMPPLALLAAWGWERAMAWRPWAGRLFAALLVLALGLSVAANHFAGRVTQARGSEDVARVLACQANPQDTVYATGEYPYDLPFYTQSSKPMVVVQDWPALRRNSGDNWRRELFEGANFDPAAATVLQTPDVLVAAATQAGNWLVAARKNQAELPPSGWVQVHQGRAWTLYASAPKRPEAAQGVGLKGCKDHGTKQR